MSSPQKENVLGDLYTSMTGAGHGHDEQPVGPPPAPVVNIGHEPDTYSTKPILSVPVFISFVMLCAFGITTAMFWYFRAEVTANDGGSNPDAKARNDKSFDERIARIASMDEKAEVKQPRLEWLRATDSTRDGKKDEPFFRSVRFSENGNSPEYRPEDLRPDNYVDPITRQKVLRDYGWVDKEKNVARIPVSVAMKIMLEKNAFPVQANQSVPVVGTATKPKLSNGGNELPSKAAKDVVAAKKDDHGHEKKEH